MAVAEASSSGGGGEEGYGAWTREQEKAFENAIATMAEEADGDARWEKIAEAVEGKTADEVRRHYELLVEDVEGIDAGRVPLPTYAADGGAEEGGGGGGEGSGRRGGGGVDLERCGRRRAVWVGVWFGPRGDVPRKTSMRRARVGKVCFGLEVSSRCSCRATRSRLERVEWVFWILRSFALRLD